MTASVQSMLRHCCLIAIICAAIFGAITSAPAQSNCQWDSAFDKLKTTHPFNVVQAVEFDDGNGTALYVCGRFNRTLDDLTLRGIAKWNGFEWEDVDGGVTREDGNPGSVNALAVHDDGQGGGPALYVAGLFTKAGEVPATNIARWDGESWSPVGEGISNSLSALIITDVLGGPPVLLAGGSGATKVAKWDGKLWSPVGTIVNGNVKTFEVFDDGTGEALYAGGFFPISFNKYAVMKWTGTVWQPVGQPFSYPYITNPSIDDLIGFNDGTGNHLYAGGTFDKFGDTDCWYIARWDGQTWSPMGLGFDGTIQSFAVFDDGSGNGLQLFAGGYAESVANVPGRWTHVHGVAKWNGINWTSAGGGVSGASLRPNVSSISVIHSAESGAQELLVGGDFADAAQVPSDGLATWNGQTWQSFAEPLLYNSVSVSALCLFDDGLSDQPSLYVTGTFRYGGAERLNFIGRWDGKQWQALGDGLNAYSNIKASALHVFDLGNGPELFVGGSFDAAGDVESENVARWNGQEWNAIPGDFPDAAPPSSSIQSEVNSLVGTTFPGLGGPGLFVTGTFTTISGQTFNGIAKWDGSSWTPLGTGLGQSNGAGSGDQLVISEESADPSLYVIGFFDKASGVPTKQIARWNGSSWFAVGDNQSQRNFAALGTFHDGASSHIVATGEFEDTNGVGMWNAASNSWNLIAAVPTITNNLKVLLERPNGHGTPSDLYLGGFFSTVNGVPANQIAQWNGNQWSEVNGGLGKAVAALALGPENVLYVGSSSPTMTGVSNAPTLTRLVCELIPGDIVPPGGDGTVNLDDLLSVINAWGPCEDADNCPADIAPLSVGNAVVDVDDLLVVINNWS